MKLRKMRRRSFQTGRPCALPQTCKAVGLPGGPSSWVRAPGQVAWLILVLFVFVGRLLTWPFGVSFMWFLCPLCFASASPCSICVCLLVVSVFLSTSLSLSLPVVFVVSVAWCCFCLCLFFRIVSVYRRVVSVCLRLIVLVLVSRCCACLSWSFRVVFVYRRVVYACVALGSSLCKLCSTKYYWEVVCVRFVVHSSTGK